MYVCMYVCIYIYIYIYIYNNGNTNKTNNNNHNIYNTFELMFNALYVGGLCFVMFGFMRVRYVRTHSSCVCVSRYIIS